MAIGGRLKASNPISLAHTQMRHKDNNHAIPKVIIKRIVQQILTKKNRIEKKALKIIQSEIEKYITEIFMISNIMVNVSKRSTVYPHIFKKATSIHNFLVHS
jgi:histone H3/H4